MFTLTETKPYSRTGDYGTTYQFNTTLAAAWSWEDGVRLYMRERPESTFVSKSRRSPVTRTQRRELEAKPRIYVRDERPFDVIEDLTNRTRRPYAAYRPLVFDALARVGVEDVKISWSQKAGCSMCPCSPGFILTGLEAPVDFWLTVPDAPMVDESKPGRVLVA